MAGASTDSRWVNISGLTIGGVDLNDALGASGGASAQMLGSSSESDRYANHFLQGVELGEQMTIRVFDFAGLVSLRSSGRIGKGTSMSFTINKAITSGSASNVTASASSPNAVISDIQYNHDHNAEHVGEITFAFKSPDGASFGLSLS